MDLFELIATVVILSTSGVMSPGPLFVATISRAIQSGGRSGIECAIGHTLVELPLVIGLAIGSLIWLRDNPIAVRSIGLVGGIMLLFFAALQVQEARSLSTPTTVERVPEARYASRPGVFLGAIFTALNPFFILWWLSVGVQLIQLAVVFSAIAGVAVMYLAHIWMDFAWLGGAGLIASRRRFSLGKWYRILMVGFAVAMAYFGIVFIVSSVS